MTGDNENMLGIFDEASFVQRHKVEAHNMFELLDHILGSQVSFDFALDIGGGYGDHLPFVQDRIGAIIAADIIEYSNDENFSLKDIARRSEKYGGRFDLSKVDFHTCDAQKLYYKDEIFDFVFSINAFEHIPNPLLALAEARRVARTGAPIYIQFDPIWNSPWGHHLPHLNFEPWTHLLLNDEDFSDLILKKGGTENDILIFKTAMSRKSFSYYRRIFLEDFRNMFVNPSFVYWSNDPSDEPATNHPNFNLCRAKGYNIEELIVRGVQFVGVKA
ncbi:hypothetical protein C0214_18465 [Methylobacterium sp. DM1]|nr:hypothetical protein C0214_18465 [Methylobacterium sp. DM1]